jgi:hypothetical protein
MNINKEYIFSKIHFFSVFMMVSMIFVIAMTRYSNVGCRAYIITIPFFILNYIFGYLWVSEGGVLLDTFYISLCIFNIISLFPLLLLFYPHIENNKNDMLFYLLILSTICTTDLLLMYFIIFLA